MMNDDELRQRIRVDGSAVLVTNTRSRHGERLAAHAREELTRRGLHIVCTFPVADPSRLPEVLEDAAAVGTPLVVVGGGDGTLTSAAGVLAYRDIALGLLPLGTGNSFARSLGIPLSLGGAAQVIARGEVAAVDLGRVNGRYFANAAAVGLSAVAARAVSPLAKRYLGPAAYVLAGARALWHSRPFRCTVHTAEAMFAFTTTQVIVGNGRYFGDAVLAPEASLQNGSLVLRTLDALTPMGQWGRWVALLHGLPTALADCHAITAREFWLTTDPPQYLDTDGEALPPGEAHFTVAPRALRVLVPPGFWG